MLNSNASTMPCVRSAEGMDGGDLRTAAPTNGPCWGKRIGFEKRFDAGPGIRFTAPVERDTKPETETKMNDGPAILGLRTLIYRADAAYKAACNAPVTPETSALVERINTYLCGLGDAAAQMGVSVPEFTGDVRCLCGSTGTVEFCGAKFAVSPDRLVLLSAKDGAEESR